MVLFLRDLISSLTLTHSDSTLLHIATCRAKFEQTIQGLMAQKGLTRGQAEKRYGEFLADPDGASAMM